MAYQRRGAPPSFNHPPSRPAAARVRDALSAYSCKISFYSQTYLHPCKSHGKVENLPENQLKNSGMIWSNRKGCRKFAKNVSVTAL